MYWLRGQVDFIASNGVASRLPAGLLAFGDTGSNIVSVRCVLEEKEADIWSQELP